MGTKLWLVNVTVSEESLSVWGFSHPGFSLRISIFISQSSSTVEIILFFFFPEAIILLSHVTTTVTSFYLCHLLRPDSVILCVRPLVKTSIPEGLFEHSTKPPVGQKTSGGRRAKAADRKSKTSLALFGFGNEE